MRLPIRIKFSEDLIDQRCLTEVGGYIACPIGKPPAFVFGSEMQRIQYDALRKERREKAAAPTVTISEL